MLHYTARNGTTFQFDEELNDDFVYLIGSDSDLPQVAVELADLREFLQYLEERSDAESDADLAAVGPD